MAKKSAKKSAKSKRTRKSPPQLDLNLPVFQVKITLKDIGPPIWRRIETKDCSLDDLHAIIQLSMGWEFAHMYAFEVHGEDYFDAEYGGGMQGHDSRETLLRELVGGNRLRFNYVYDFGDDWEHEILIEKTLPVDPAARYPRCVAGARACPPEDSGGPYSYPDLLDALEDPEHEDLDSFEGIVSENFDPEAFDLDQTNKVIRKARL